MDKKALSLILVLLNAHVSADAVDLSVDDKSQRPVESWFPVIPQDRPVSVITGDYCGYYREKVAEPVIKPPDEISVSASSDIRFEQYRSGATLRAVVNGESIPPPSQLRLKLGKNIVDFVVTGKGDRHSWDAVFMVDDEVVFQHRALKLPRFRCNGELYRYRITFHVKPEVKEMPPLQPAVKRKYSAGGKDCIGLVYEPIKVELAETTGCVSRDEAAALLERPVITYSGPPKEEGYQFLHMAGQPIRVATCSDYVAARMCGAYANSKFAITTDSQFSRTCGTLAALRRAKQPIASHIGDDPLNLLHRLPVGLLPAMHDGGINELYMYSGGMTVAGYVNTGRAHARKWPKRIWLGHAEASTSLSEIARSDFDGDGLEDALVAVTGNYGGVSLMLLTRYDEAEPRFTFLGEHLTCDDDGVCDAKTGWSPWPVDKDAPICARLKSIH
jgi:hypothetical protein